MSRRLSRFPLPLPRLFSLALLLLVFNGPGPFGPFVCTAQTLANNPTTAEKTESASEKKAFELLDTLAGRITTLRSPENRVYAGCAVADLLWSKDEKRARALFETLTKEMAALVAEIDMSDAQAYSAFSLAFQLRQEVIGRMARHDPDMALAFLRATRMQSSYERFGGNFGSERDLELQLANLVAANDPQRALSMARARLSHGVSYPLVSLLSQIQSKDPKAASELYQEMVDRIRDEDFERNPEALNAAWNLAGAFQPPQANEETYKQLIELLAGYALSVVPGDSSRTPLTQNLYNNVQSYMSQISKYAPARAAALPQWSQSIERTFDAGTRMYLEINAINRNAGSTVDDVLALAQRYGVEFQPQIYQQAAWKAISSGNGERARQIATDYIKDPVQREQLLAQIENQSLWNNVNENKIDEARRRLRKVRDLEQRVQIMIQMASNLAGTDDKKGALDLLNEARQLVASSPQTANKLQAQLQLARSYAALDPDQSFVIIQSAIAQVNQLIEAAAVLDGFENRYLQEGEWLRRGQTGLSNLVNNLEENLALLAGQDVDRALHISDQLERAEIRLMAQLQIAQGVLTRNGTLNQNGALNCIGLHSNNEARLYNRGFVNRISGRRIITIID